MKKYKKLKYLIKLFEKSESSFMLGVLTGLKIALTELEKEDD